MAEDQKQSADIDDLLKNAIPIDAAGEDDEEDDGLDVEELDVEEEAEAPSAAVKSAYAAEAVPTVDLTDEPTERKRQVGRIGAKAARQEKWTRQVDQASHGATHVRTFVAKLTKEGIAYMDEQINTWLAENPTAVVKLVTVAQGDIIGRTRDPSLLVSVWV